MYYIKGRIASINEDFNLGVGHTIEDYDFIIARVGRREMTEMSSKTLRSGHDVADV